MKQHPVQNTAVGDVTSLYCSSPFVALHQNGLQSAKTCCCMNCINIQNIRLKVKIVCNIETPFCLQGRCSDKFYFITSCWDLSQTDVGCVELVLSSSSVAANNWIFQIFVEEKSYWMKLLPLHLSIKLDCSVHIINLDITGDISTVFQSQFISCQQMWLKTLRIKCRYWCRNCW
jgi:hypothetical protein